MFPDHPSSPEQENKTGDMHQGIRGLWRASVVVPLLALVLGAVSLYCLGDAKIAAAMASTVAVTGGMVVWRYKQPRRKNTPAISPLRMIVNIVIATAIMAMIIYIYTRGIDNYLAP